MQKIENSIQDFPTLEKNPEDVPNTTELELWGHFEAATEDEMFLSLLTFASGHFKWFKRTTLYFSPEISKVQFEKKV
eukprot:snap_masked-scaffold_9-processed-gene-4.16-mRNA-1 protein AED:1.00 eAED:1.00 QI:0/-1/0/0/-1/1/1/0/76